VDAVGPVEPLTLARAGVGADDEHMAYRRSVPGSESESGEMGSDDLPAGALVGEEHDVKITDVGAKGDGITKIENFIVFVAGAKKGEECRIRIKEVASRFAIGEKIGSSAGSSSESTDEASDSESEESSEKSDEESE